MNIPPSGWRFYFRELWAPRCLDTLVPLSLASLSVSVVDGFLQLQARCFLACLKFWSATCSPSDSQLQWKMLQKNRNLVVFPSFPSLALCLPWGKQMFKWWFRTFRKTRAWRDSFRSVGSAHVNFPKWPSSNSVCISFVPIMVSSWGLEGGLVGGLGVWTSGFLDSGFSSLLF